MGGKSEYSLITIKSNGINKEVKIMKKVFYSLCVVFVCTLVWVACSDDDSISESRESVNKARLEAIIQKYGVNFVLNDSILSTEISDSDLAELENALKCLSGIRGTYKLRADSVNTDMFIGKQMKQQNRNRRLTQSIEIFNYDTWYFDSERKYDNNYNTSYNCTCLLEWKSVNGVIRWAKADPNIIFNENTDQVLTFYIEKNSNDYDITFLTDTTFAFEGDYTGNIIRRSDFGYFGFVTFHYEGEFCYEDSYISWTYSDSEIRNTRWRNRKTNVMGK